MIFNTYNSGQSQLNGHQFIGYALDNFAGRTMYKKVENYECQYLCQITEGCYYYNYEDATKECWLKYGMGYHQASNGFNFGHKNSLNVTANVNCEVEFTSCSVTCGEGVRNKIIITDQRGGGTPCPEQTCNLDPCPIDCKYDWSHWSSCNCSEGKQTRKMLVTVQTEHGGQECPHDERRECDEAECALDDTDKAGSEWAVGVVAVAVFVVVLIILLATSGGGYLFYKKCRKRNVIRAGSGHQVLVKNDKLKDKLNELTEDPGMLFRQFQQLETEVKNSVPQTAVKAEMNQSHNRYGDIGEWI